MYFIPAILFALSANIDSFILGISLGSKKTKISLTQNLIIGLITFSGTTAALLLGKQTFHILPLSLTRWIGNLLLILLGCYYVFQSFRHSDLFSCITHSIADTDTNPDTNTLSTHFLPFREGIFIGLTLSINNFGIGIGAGISGFSLLPTALCSLFFSIIFLSLGNKLGIHWISPASNWPADFLCGIILMILGIYEVFL